MTNELSVRTTSREELVDITDRVQIRGKSLILSGKLIRQIGLAAASKGDLSAPGMVLVVERGK